MGAVRRGLHRPSGARRSPPPLHRPALARCADHRPAAATPAAAATAGQPAAVLNRHAASGLRGKVAIYVVGGSSLLAFCAALAVLDAERRNPGANITDFGEAMWWAVTTMTTVGYGDRFPTTGPGRLVATALMVAGIALLGTVTATLASWLVEQVSRAEEREVM